MKINNVYSPTFPQSKAIINNIGTKILAKINKIKIFKLSKKFYFERNIFFADFLIK